MWRQIIFLRLQNPKINWFTKAFAIGMVIGCVTLVGIYWSISSSGSERIIFTFVAGPENPNVGLEDSNFNGEPPLHLRRSRILALNLLEGQPEPRELTEIFQAAFAPAVSYDGKRLLFSGRREVSDSFQIFEMKVSGWYRRQVTQLKGDCLDPFYLPDGRIGFSKTLPDNHNPGKPSPISLFTHSRPGSGDSHPVRITFGYCQDRRAEVLPDGRVLFRRRRLDKNKPGWLGPARWMTVNPDGTGLQRFLAGPNSPTPPFSSQPTSSGRLVISHRPSGAKTFALYEFDVKTKQVGRRIFADSIDVHALEPVVAAAHPKPKILTSMVDENKKMGWFLGLNVYLSQVPAVASLRAGSRLKLRVVETESERMLGEAPIERDGSFYIEVPADEALLLQLVGEAGRVLATCPDQWVRPNENRGCIGCHEIPELAPENKVPLAVTKPPVSVSREMPGRKQPGEGR